VTSFSVEPSSLPVGNSFGNSAVEPSRHPAGKTFGNGADQNIVRLSTSGQLKSNHEENKDLMVS
jgi:hypothetical protein